MDERNLIKKAKFPKIIYFNPKTDRLNFSSGPLPAKSSNALSVTRII